MAISLYDISVASSLQVLGGVAGALDKGAAHCTENDIDLAEVAGTRLVPDMWSFRDQIYSVMHHSLGSIKGVESGAFSPPDLDPEMDYAGCQALIASAIEMLGGYTREQVNAWEDNDVLFSLGRFELPFKAPEFVLSFSHPNLYFHATTAYDMLRMKGTPIGKMDFMGPLRTAG